MRIFVVTVETGTARRRQQAAPPPPASSLPASLWLLAPSGLVPLLSIPNWRIWMRTVPLWWDKEGASSGTQPGESIPEMPSWFTFLISIWHLIWFVTCHCKDDEDYGGGLTPGWQQSPIPSSCTSSTLHPPNYHPVQGCLVPFQSAWLVRTQGSDRQVCGLVTDYQQTVRAVHARLTQPCMMRIVKGAEKMSQGGFSQFCRI